MTVVQAANKIGVSESKIYQLVAARQIGHYRIGGKIVFSETDIDTYLLACRVGAVTPKVTAPVVRMKLKHITLKHVSLAPTNTRALE